MMNQYPAWKYALIILIVGLGFLYALPNLWVSDPAIQISSTKHPVDQALQEKVARLLKELPVSAKSLELSEGNLLVRFDGTEAQLKAADKLKGGLPNYIVALNLAPTTPGWLRSLNAKPMYLGLDLRGGLHFLMEVDMTAAIQKSYFRIDKDISRMIRNSKIRNMRHSQKSDRLVFSFASEADQEKAYNMISTQFEQLTLTQSTQADRFTLNIVQKATALSDVKKFALQQNITTLRNRINELGVAEPIIQRQGDNRVVVQLPGIQDSAYAKEILGATATLEYRLVYDGLSTPNGRVPAGSRRFKKRKGGTILLKSSIITTGDHITSAKATVDENGQPAVDIVLDDVGGKDMDRTTAVNINKPMAVVFIENKILVRRDKDGKPMLDENGDFLKKIIETREVISVATIRGHFSKRFQTTGLDNSKEAHNLALLIKAGSLKAPMYFIEERTIGPKLGQQNINQGRLSVIVGFALVLIFMGVHYKTFGLVANVALSINLVLIIACLSMLQATLTMPGIAGIVLTVGMAVDANVLIFERIKEEIRNGSTPQTSIDAGYEKALSTIADANITTLLAAIVLFSFGTGPVKGFAVTLSIGIATSMFTAIMGTRAIINSIYGGKKIQKLSI